MSEIRKVHFLLFISVVGLTTSICSCTSTKKTKEPTFLKYSNEVTREQWWEKSEIALNQSWFFNNANNPFSVSVKQSSTSSRKQLEKTGDKEKEMADTTSSFNQTSSLKVDTNHQTMEVKNEKKSTTSSDSLDIYISDDSLNYKKNRILQIDSYEGKKHIFSVNKDLKVYEVLEELNDSFTFFDKGKSALVEQFSTFFEMKERFSSYIGLDNSVSKFYIDDSVFTFTYTRDFTTSLDDYILKEYRNIIFQFDFVNHQVGRFSHTFNTTYTYNSETETHKVIQNKSTSYFEGHITLKSQNVKSVNISSFDRVMSDLE